MSLVACRCCCCLSGNCYKDMDSEYFNAGETEVYSELLKSTFDVVVIRQNVKCLICEECISSLRSAARFKRGVLRTQAAMQQRLQDVMADVKIGPMLESSESRVAVDVGASPAAGAALSGDEGGSEDEPLIYASEVKTEFAESGKNDITINKKSTAVRKSTRKSSQQENKKKVKDKEGKPNKKNSIKKPESPRSKKNESSERQALQALKESTAQLVSGSNLCPFRAAKSRLRCFGCRQAFASLAALRDHGGAHADQAVALHLKRLRTKSYISVDVSRLACRRCAQPADGLGALRAHLAAAHGVAFPAEGSLLRPYRLEDGYTCAICRAEFANLYTLSIHSNSHFKDNVCERCGATFISRAGLRNHARNRHGRARCPLCGAQFATAYGRLRHMAQAHQRRPYRQRCTLCDQSFKYRYQVKQHRVAAHGEALPALACALCDKTFSAKHGLQVHVKAVHVRERNFACEVCSMVFFTKYDVKRHLLSHGDDKPFACARCGTRFKTRDSWRRHARRQHNMPSAEDDKNQ